MFGFSNFTPQQAEQIKKALSRNSAKKKKDKGPEPPNNDGREKCWWCKLPTTKLPLFNMTYDWCKKCQK